MIKFFRKIRYDLMVHHKISKYVKYAIGEILLVVIGILIALQLNNWNENRKNKILETNYIEELRADLQKDSIAIQKLLTASNKQLSSKYKLQKYLVENGNFNFFTSYKDYPDDVKRENYHADSLYNYYEVQWKQIYNFAPITTTIDEMKSTGKIGIISNKNLRQSIIETYNNYDHFMSYYQDTYRSSQAETLKLVLDDLPELFLSSNDSILELFQSKRVLNRFQANFVVTINKGLLELQKVNQKLLNALKE